MNRSLRKYLAAAIVLLPMLFGCEEKVVVEKVIEVPAYPDLEDIRTDTLTYNAARLEFYGAYSQTVDRWYLTLFTEDNVGYDLATDRYSGSGSVLKLCLHTGISEGTQADIPTILGIYHAPEGYSDLQIGQFETGYQRSFEHPHLGRLDATYGSYALDLDSAGDAPAMFIDGVISVSQTSGGNYKVGGMLVDAAFVKHHFVFEGPIDAVYEYDFPGAPDSIITEDITVTRQDLPRIEIRDKGDQYRYDGSFRNYRVYLTGEGVTVSQTSSILDRVKLSGEGAVMLLDLFVSPDADGRIPAGEYLFCPREYNNGIDGSYIKPFHFVAGYPRRYSDPQGCWLFNLGADGMWQGEYAMVNGGTLKVSYEDGSDLPVIEAEFIDCSQPAHRITLNWK